ncbi:hypothetical protein [Mesorhizobium sp. M1252]|uniref:hypothetical protein n=1 Tax=Mesorhizobium sp. M1252 TaxID=2957073 RepID=UPI00333AF584
MTATRIVSQDYEVGARLADWDLTAKEMIEVVRHAVAAKASYVLNFPLNAAGQLSYIHGTGALRDILRLKGWEIDRTGNIEATYNPKTGMKIVFQNSDSACEDDRDPKAISDKGPAAARAVDLGQMSLFPEFEIEAQQQKARENASLWYLCVYINGDDVRAELSFPQSIEEKQFKNFNERIYIIRPGEWASIMPKQDDDETPSRDFEINVTRKK